MAINRAVGLTALGNARIKEMKTIIAGTTTIKDFDVVKAAIEKSGFEISEVVSGSARGVDSLGELWAKRRNIPVTRFPAEWSRYGRSAGPIRNRQMAEYAEALIAVWNGRSRGTRDMIRQARRNGLKVFIFLVEEGGCPEAMEQRFVYAACA